MDNKKNLIIGALAVLLLTTSIWGQSESRRRKELQLAKGAGTHQTPASKDFETELKTEAHSRQAAGELETAKKELDVLRKRNAELEVKAAAEGKDGSQQEELAKLQSQIAQQQAVLEQQEQKLASAAKVIEREQERVKQSEAVKAQADEALAKLQGQNAKIQEKQNAASAEAESLRAQVIGLEKMVEERGAAFSAAAKELENCRLNSNILIAKIAEQAKQEQRGCVDGKVTAGDRQDSPVQESSEQTQPVQQ